jgi:hypothetical protein
LLALSPAKVSTIMKIIGLLAEMYVGGKLGADYRRSDSVPNYCHGAYVG